MRSRYGIPWLGSLPTEARRLHFQCTCLLYEYVPWCRSTGGRKAHVHIHSPVRQLQTSKRGENSMPFLIIQFLLFSSYVSRERVAFCRVTSFRYMYSKNPAVSLRRIFSGWHPWRNAKWQVLGTSPRTANHLRVLMPSLE